MKIVEFTSDGFRVPDGTYSFRRDGGAADVVVVTGPPGAGKTMLLRLMAGAKEAFAPYGAPPDLRRLLRPDRTTGRLTLTVLLDARECNQTKLDAALHQVAVDVEPRGALCQGLPALRRAFVAADRSEEALVSRWSYFPHASTLPSAIGHAPDSRCRLRPRRVADCFPMPASTWHSAGFSTTS